MKPNSTFLLMLFFFAAGLTGQCTFYNYTLSYEGFASCDSPDGLFCVNTNADLMSGPACADDYVFQLSFPSGDFVYTDLMDWAAVSVDPSGLTILEFQGTYIFDILDRGCLKGRIQQPNMTFDLSLVNINDPNDILSTETISFDAQIMEIGVTGGSITVSQAIIDGGLLSVSQANFNGQRILINGELVVDVDYRFNTSSTAGNRSNSEIIMAENSSITINSGVRLSLNDALVRGCDNDKWDQILIKDDAELVTGLTEIRNANTAVELLDGGIFSAVNRTVFRNNDVGIASYGPNEKEITINITGIGGPGGNLVNIFGDDSGVGINLNNTNPLNIRGCAFYDLSAGIYTDNTSMIIRDCQFEDNAYGVLTTGAIGMVDIRESTMSNNFIGFFLSSGTVGFMQYSNNFSIANIIGLYFLGAENSEIRIESNDFFLDRAGVLGSVFQSNGRIQENNMNCGLHNVRLNGLGGVDHLWEVSFNTLALTSANSNAANVYFNNMNCARVFKNSTMDGSRNVYIAGGSDNVVGYNTAMNGDENSIYLMDSPLNLVYCNEVIADQAFNLLNNCSGADIRGNEFSGSDANIQYGSSNNPFALAGEQSGKGNVFDVSSLANLKALDFNTFLETATSNSYIIDNLNSQGDEYYPFFQSIFSNWIKIGPVSDYTCPTGLTSPDTVSSDQILAAIYDYFDANDSLGHYYGDAAVAGGNSKVLRELDRISLPVNSKYAGEVTTLENSDYGSYHVSIRATPYCPPQNSARVLPQTNPPPCAIPPKPSGTSLPSNREAA